MRRENFKIFLFLLFVFFFISMKIGQQVFIRTKGKVNLRDESYACTPKS